MAWAGRWARLCQAVRVIKHKAFWYRNRPLVIVIDFMLSTSTYEFRDLI